MRENNANRFLLRIANLLISIHNGGIFKLLYSPDLKMVLIIFFLLRKSFKGVQCSNESVFHSYMKFYVTQWSATLGLECVQRLWAIIVYILASHADVLWG